MQQPDPKAVEYARTALNRKPTQRRTPQEIIDRRLADADAKRARKGRRLKRFGL